jgi:hypothetical protein
MGTASSYSPCGCRWTRLLEHPDNIWIEWVRCAEHHNPKVDDAMILNAAKNKRVYEGGNGEYEPAPFNRAEKERRKEPRYCAFPRARTRSAFAFAVRYSTGRMSRQSKS